MEKLQTEVNELKIKIAEQKTLLMDASLHKEAIASENLSLKQDIKVLNVQIREQQEAILKSKIYILKITEEKEKIQQQFDMQTAEKANIINEHTSSGLINSQTKTNINKTQKLSTEEVTGPNQSLKSVSPTEFFEKMYEMWNKEDCLKTPQCAKCGKTFENQTPFFKHVIKEHNAPVLVARKYKIKSDKNHPDFQEGGGTGQVSHEGSGLPGQS